MISRVARTKAMAVGQSPASRRPRSTGMLVQARSARLGAADGQPWSDPAHSRSAFVLPTGQLCGLFAVDIAGFNGVRRDDDIQLYMHRSMYDMLETAFDKSEIIWNDCAREDRGDGVLVVIPPTTSVADLVHPIPDRLRSLIRRHNRVSCEAARIQLRVATHIGPVHHDGHGFVGHDVNLLSRLLDARQLKRLLAESGAEIAFITSGYLYENIIRRRPSLVDPGLFKPLSVQVKETRTRAWVYTLGPLADLGDWTITPGGAAGCGRENGRLRPRVGACVLDLPPVSLVQPLSPVSMSPVPMSPVPELKRPS
jgi:hypothetical protein